MAESEVPLRTQSAYLVRGGLKNRAGTVLLYPDRLVHVGSTLAQVGAGFGLVGLLVTGSIAKAQAAGTAARGGKGVTCIRLADVRDVHAYKSKFRSRLLVIETVAGDQFRFGVKFEAWADQLEAALRELGRQVTPADDRLLVR